MFFLVCGIFRHYNISYCNVAFLSCFVCILIYDFSLLVSASSVFCHVLALVFPSQVFVFMFGFQPEHTPRLRLHSSVISGFLVDSV